MAKELPAMMIEELGRGASKLMSISTKVNRFLDGNFTIPANIREADEWLPKQSNGIVSAAQIEAHLSAIVEEKVDGQVEAKAKWLAAQSLTPAQTAQVTDSIVRYREFLNSYVRAAVNARKVLRPAPAAKPVKAPAVK